MVHVKPKTNQKTDRLSMKCSFNTNVQHIPQPPNSKSTPIRLHSTLFCYPFIFKEYLNPQVRIKKITNKPSLNYHPTPSELTSRMHALLFLQTLYLYQDILLNVLLKQYISTSLEKIFTNIVLRPLENAFAS